MMLVRGFTLIELMITVAIAAILLAIGVPSFRDFVVNTRISTDSSNLLADLAFARSEAVKRGLPITVCAKAAGSDSCAAGWTNGRLVFVDLTTPGTTGVYDVTTDTLLRVREAVGAGNTMSSSNFSNGAYIQYFPSGGSDSAGLFQITRAGFTGRNLCVNATGRVRINTSSNCALP